MTGSSRLAEARPVRSPDKLGLQHRHRAVHAAVESLKSSPSSIVAIPDPRRLARGAQPAETSVPTASPATIRARAPGFVNVEDDYRQSVVAGKRKGGGVHDREALRDRLLVGHVIVADGVRIAARVGGIDAVDLRALQQRVAFELERPQRRPAVGGEERVAGAAGEHDDAPCGSCARRRADARRSRRSTASRSPRARAPPCPRGESAASSASAFMTVASMPMWSPVTRSPPLAEIATPRKRLPPPITTAISVPARATSAISRGEAGQRRVVDAEGLIPQQRLARELEQDPAGLWPRGHDRSSHLPPLHGAALSA